jgi:hypothetical protein
MQFTGKKTTRLWLPRQICVDPFLAAELRDRAERNSRKLEDHIRFVFMLGLQREDELNATNKK